MSLIEGTKYNIIPIIINRKAIAIINRNWLKYSKKSYDVIPNFYNFGSIFPLVLEINKLSLICIKLIND